VKIPEFKCCAATVEKASSPRSSTTGRATENLTPESSPEMFPYQMGESARHSPEESSL
jgi:hypothetical protein